MKKVLIIEDDRLAAQLERDYLEASGMEVVICGDGIRGLDMAQHENYDLVILDVMLPGMNGFDICREIRKEQNVPIIFITARGEENDKVRGLGLGADDYIVKPFNPREMIARVQAHIKIHGRLLADRDRISKDENIVCKDLVISVPQRQVTVRGKEVILKNREYELLVFLASHPGIVFSKDMLIDRLWGMDAVGDTATVMVHVNRIREKIEENPQKPEYILTVWGAGYKFAQKTSAQNGGEGL